jgi:hypothetical protein
MMHCDDRIEFASPAYAAAVAILAALILALPGEANVAREKIGAHDGLASSREISAVASFAVAR